MSEYIPLEIQAEILKRLPIKPLIQFRSVSKSFKCLIDSPDFIVSYGVHHPQPHDRFILRYTQPWSLYYFPEDIYITFVDNDDDHSFVQQEFIPTVPDLIKTLEPDSRSIVGSSHGLLCFNGYYEFPDVHSDGLEMAVLWNPSIRKSVGIRVPYMSYKPNEDFCDVGEENVFGFGVCPVTFDPTVLKITCIDYKRKRNDMSCISVPWKVGVFTLSTGTWSILSANLPSESIRLRGSQVLIDRFIYWVAEDKIDVEDGRSQSHYLIMSFDLTAKEFKEINLTDNLTNRRCRIEIISKLRESLVLLEYHREFEEDVSVCCLWMMKEQGVCRSFTKLYTINLPDDATINQILGFRKTGELIMETLQEPGSFGNVQIYERNHEYTENLGIDGEEYSFSMCPYMETLLLLDKSDGYMYISSNSTYMITHG